MIIFMLAVLGLVFGSFVNALIWRMHEQEGLEGQKTKAALKRKKELSMVQGRSMCSHCGHELAPKDLVPVLSWLSLGGKCRYCKVKIQDNPLVELLTGALFVFSYIYWPLSFHGVDLFQFVVWLGFIVAFVALAAYDLHWFLLPNRIVYPLIAAAILEVLIVALDTRSGHFLLDSGIGALIIAGTFYVLFQVSGGRWIGGGDVKLAVILGLLAGTAPKAILVIFLASVIGTFASIPLLAKGRQGLQARVPFGPFLLTATFVVVLFGSSLVNWYDKLLR